MKLILFLSAIMLSSNALQFAVMKIEFTSLTRGYEERTIITIDSTIVYKPNDQYHVNKFSLTTRKKDWKQLLNSFGNLELVEIPNLKSPTNKRAFDGARHSSIIITTTSQETYRHAFDDENPDEKLAGLMRCIEALRNKTIVP